jgi:hypothetical protein
LLLYGRSKGRQGNRKEDKGLMDKEQRTEVRGPAFALLSSGSLSELLPDKPPSQAEVGDKEGYAGESDLPQTLSEAILPPGCRPDGPEANLMPPKALPNQFNHCNQSNHYNSSSQINRKRIVKSELFGVVV